MLCYTRYGMLKRIILAAIILFAFAILGFYKNNISPKKDAVAKVKALPEVKDYLKRVSSGLVAINGEVDNSYLIQVYEIKNDHTATFNWYKVDKKTGEIKKEF